MSRKFDPKHDGSAIEKCHELGLHPNPFPMGDDHHTDSPILEIDAKIGDALAYFLGGLFIDKESADPSIPLKDSYWYKEMTSVDIWSRVARALRIHGLKISDKTIEVSEL